MTVSDVDLRRATIVLIGLDLTLVLIYLIEVSLGTPSWTLHQLADLDAEATVAAWYTSSKLLLAGILFLLLAGKTTTRGATPRTQSPRVASATVSVLSGRFSRRPTVAHADASDTFDHPLDASPDAGSRAFLLLVGLAFLLLSADETASFHEQITLSLRRFEALPRFTGDHGMWIPFLIAGVTGFMAVTASSWRRLWHHERRGTLLMGIGLALGFLGAVGLEIVSYEIIRPAGTRILYVLEVAAEEGLELLGATALLIGSARIARAGVVTREPAVRPKAS